MFFVGLFESRGTNVLGAFPLNQSMSLVKLENKQMLLLPADIYFMGHVFPKVDECSVLGGLWSWVIISPPPAPCGESQPSGSCSSHLPTHGDAVQIWRFQHFGSSSSYPPRTTSTPPPTPPSLPLPSTTTFMFCLLPYPPTSQSVSFSRVRTCPF